MKNTSLKLTVCLSFAFLCLMIVFTGTAKAQATADIVGTVTDATNAVVAGATVTLTNTGTNAARSMQTTTSGDYAFTLLPVGTYSVTVEQSGFKKFSAADIAISAGDRARVDAKLEIGSQGTIVEVKASSAPLLQTDSSSVGGLISSTSVQDLPTNGRNFIKLVQLAPGASEGGPSTLSGGTRPDDRRQTSTVVANGQNDSSNNFLLDGMDNNERAISTIIVKPSIDALQEVKVTTNLFTADTGRVGGAVVTMVTKSGSNTLHGSAYEFFRNDIFDAKDHFLPAGQPIAELRQNQFGVSVGGPVIKDKAFFFVDYEGLRIVQGQTLSATTPSLCELGLSACGPNSVKQLGNFADLCAAGFNGAGTCANAGQQIYNPLTQAAVPFNLIPAGSLNSVSRNYAALLQSQSLSGFNSCTVGQCQFTRSPKKTQYFHTADARGDYHFGDKDNVFGRYTINNGDSFFPGVLAATPSSALPANPGYAVSGNAVVAIGGIFPGTNYGRQQNVTLGWAHIFRPTLLLDLHAAMSRYVSQSIANNVGHDVTAAFGQAGVGVPGLPGTDGLALVNFQNGGYQALGDQFALPTDYWDTNYQYVGALTWTKNAHTFKFGVSVLRRNWMTYQQLFKGEFQFSQAQTSSGFNTTSGGNSFASFLYGYLNNQTRNVSVIKPLDRNWEIGEFAQDDWRLKKWLTLNLGIRYDIFTPFTEKHNQISNFDPTNAYELLSGRVAQAGVNNVPANLWITSQRNMFQPRLGFAATLADGFVLRGGFGTTYYPSNTASPANLKNQPFSAPIAITASAFQGSTNPTATLIPAFGAIAIPSPFPINQVNACLIQACGSTTIKNIGGGVSTNFQNAMLYMYNLTLEKAFGANVVSAGWLSEPGRHLGRAGINANLPLPPGFSQQAGCGISTTLVNGVPTGTQISTSPGNGPLPVQNNCLPYAQQLPFVSTISLLQSNGVSSYNALDVIFNRRLSQGLTIQASYVWAHALADAGGPGGGCGTCSIVPLLNTAQMAQMGGTPFHNGDYDYGNSDFDVRHRVAIGVNYELPFGQSHSGVEKVLLGGWQMNTIYSFASGLPLNISETGNLGINGTGDRPNKVSGNGFTQSINEWFDTSQFTLQPFGQPGNSHRNSLQGPATFRVDFSLFKDFRLTERFALEFRTEAFNLFNQTNYAAPGTAISAFASGSFNTCAAGGANPNSFCGGGVPTNAGNFGRITSTNALYTPRQIQFALKLTF